MTELELIDVEDEYELRERCRRLLVERAHMEETVQVLGLRLLEAREAAREFFPWYALMQASSVGYWEEKCPWLTEAQG